MTAALKQLAALVGSMPAIYDEPRPCKGEFDSFDQLIDGDADERRYAARAIRGDGLCGGCEVRPQCWILNRHEPWMRMLLDDKKRRASSKRGARLEEMVEAGAKLPAAVAYFKISEGALRGWCHRNERMDLWRALATSDEEDAA